MAYPASMELPVTTARKQIDNYAANGYHGDLSGLLILERRNATIDGRNGFNCLTYVMQKIKGLRPDTSFDPCPIWAKGFHRVFNPMPQDLAIYIDTSIPLPEQVHIGIVRTPNLVESKWGNYHIFLHQLASVPTYYGNKLLFFRR
ncbi:MAG TPA: hypothetical protein VK158_03430 [Acidobacteriota bacterium]|nr:hypothetical protein [Acidobacteriota bacterium]